MARGKQKHLTSSIWTLLSAIGSLLRSPISIAWMLSIGGLITLTAMSVPKLRATTISAADVQVSFDAPPSWLDDSLLKELQDVARIRLASTPIGRAGLMQTVDALLATGWFSDVEQVQWVNDHLVEVQATFLVPYAKIHDEDGDTFIDAQARKLPSRIGAIVKPNYHFITLDHPSHRRPQRPGLQWGGGDIQAGLELLKRIYDEKQWVTQIQSINLAHWIADGSMILVTDTPSHLIWGSAPGEERGLEALADEKIRRLNWMFTKYGRIDQGISRDFDLTDTDQIILN